MSRASIDQNDFRGGEWGPYSVGRASDPKYTTALYTSLNGLPTEEGSWTRRAGTQYLLPAASKRTYAKLLSFEGSETCSFAMEFTGIAGADNGILRLLTQTGVVCTNDAATVVASDPSTGTVQLSSAPDWGVGDLIQFVFPDPSTAFFPYPAASMANLQNFVLQITDVGTGNYAQGFVTFSGNPANDDTLTLDGTALTFVTGTPTSMQVQIGATIAITLDNLITVLGVGGGNLGNMTYSATGSILVVNSSSTGTGGNAYTLAASSSVIALSGATLTGGSASGSFITFTYDNGASVNTALWPAGALVNAQVLHHLTIATPYTGQPQLSTLRAIQAEVNSIILSAGVAPQEVQITTQGTLSTDPVVVMSPLTLVDGPYMDPQDETLTVSGYSGTITVTAGAAVFVSTDVGRLIRIFTQPPIYNIASTYTMGQSVTDSSGAWWTALANVAAGQEPGQVAYVSGVPSILWAPAPTAGSWGWGTISGVTDSMDATVVLDAGAITTGFGLQSANGDAAYEWQLGVYSNTTAYPTCGVFYEGRLWLAGAITNRFDTTTSNGVSQVIGTNYAIFSPTDQNGNVLDSSGMSEILNSSGINQIQWMVGDKGGVLMGTLHGENLVEASTLGDPITPTSIQVHEGTRYGSISNIDAIRAGMAVVFVQKNGRRVMEFIDDAFTGKPSGRHLNEEAKHLTLSGVANIAYLEEPVPLVFGLMNDGSLAGCTYRRFSRFAQTPPEVDGWHKVQHGEGRVFTSMCTVPDASGLNDRLFTATAIPATGSAPQANYYIEVLQAPIDPSLPVTAGWFLDQSGSIGVGNSGYDCGGGNPSGYFPSGSYSGGDSVTPDVSTVPPYPAITAPGVTAPDVGIILLGAGNAVNFDGQTALTGLPPIGNSEAMSMSVWMALENFPMGTGAFFSMPSYPWDDTSGIQGMSAFLTYFGNDESYDSSEAPTANQWFITNESTGGWSVSYNGTSLVPVDPTLSAFAGLTWVHIMIAAKVAAGTLTLVAYVNDTEVINTTDSSFSSSGWLSANGLWPTTAQPDYSSYDGPNTWTIGGTAVGDAAGLAAVDGGAGGTQISNTPGYGYHPVQGDNGAAGPVSYGPIETGFRGDVAELWLSPTYVDWTSSTNRNKFQTTFVDGFFNTIWAPISLGAKGETPLGHAPWVYCSGDHNTFYINRATGSGLNVYWANRPLTDNATSMGPSTTPFPPTGY